MKISSNGLIVDPKSFPYNFFMLQEFKNKYWGTLVKWFHNARRLVLWIPIFSLLIGSIVSASVYVYLKQREIDAQKSNSYQRARETINQIDLQLSNSLLRVQTYEDSWGPRPVNYQTEHNYITQSLQYTLFHRLSICRDMKSNQDSPPSLKMLARINRENSNLPPLNNSFIQSKAVIDAVQHLKENLSLHKTLLYEFDHLPRLSVVMRSKNHRDVFFIFTAPLIALFEKIDLSVGESIFVQDANRKLGWEIKAIDSEKNIRKLEAVPFKSDEKAFFHFMFDNGLPQSGVALNFQFNYAKAEPALISSANIGGLLSAFITLIISYLFYVLITLNRTAQRMIINKTLDLEKTAHDLQEALNGKTRFLGKISHEIRTPLNLILGMIDLCEENDTEKKLSHYLRSMKSSGEHLLSMIDDLLDLAKAESNDLNFHGRKTYLVQLLSDVTKLCSADCEAKGLKFYTYFSPDLPNIVICDPNRLRQVLLNLLRNASKYTNQGHIRLNVSPIDQHRPANMKIRFEIQDTGVGIPRDKLNKVFDAFFQVESSSSFSEGGVGLGLSIVKDIVKKMNGQIEVQSSLNSGSVFRVDLDLEVFDRTSWVESYKSDTNDTKNILVFSQNPLLLKSFEPLKRHPLLKITTPTSDNFISSLRDLQETLHNFVVVDTETSGINLDELIKQLKGRVLILIGKTASINSSVSGALIAVMNNTPFLGNEILAHFGLSTKTRLRKWAKPFTPAEEVQKLSSKPQEKLKLIVADDDLGNVELYKAYFSKTLWEISYATNGLEAWEFYQKEVPDLMILDVRMPFMDGFAVIERVREQEKSLGIARIPIIVVTADLLDYTTEKAKQFEKVTLLSKPLKKTRLFEQIQTVL